MALVKMIRSTEEPFTANVDESLVDEWTTAGWLVDTSVVTALSENDMMEQTTTDSVAKPTRGRPRKS